MTASRGALCAVLLSLLATPLAAQGTDVIQRPQGNIVSPSLPGLPPDVLPQGSAPTSPDMPDERPLWRLLSAGDDATLEERIARLRLAYPRWQPPAQMLSVLARRGDERAMAQAKSQRDWATVRRIAAAHPEMAACTRPDDAAVVAAAPGATSTLAQAFAACPSDPARIALLAAAANRFGDAVAAPLLGGFDEAALPAEMRTRIAAFRTDEAMRRLGQALADGAPDALALGETLRPAIETRRDGGMATALGYAAMKAGKAREAIAWFDTGRRLDPGQSGEGLARAYAAAGETDAARKVLADTQGPQSLTSGAGALLRDIEEAQIATDYQRGAYAEVVARAAHLPDPPIVLGWSLFRLHRLDAAAAAFERRYRNHREPAAAEGLVLSLVEAGRSDAAEAAAARLGGAVRTALAVTPAATGADLGYRLAVGRLRTALDHHDATTAARLADTLSGPVVARRDFGVAITLGYAAFEQNRLAEAARWFALGAQAPLPMVRDDAEYGAALVAFRQGDSAAAETAAAAHPGPGQSGMRWRQLQLDSVMQRAQRLTDADPDSPEGLVAAREVLRLDPQRRDAAMLLAWSDVRAGRGEAGAATFARLYRSSPDDASASGLASADLTQAQALAAELGGPLQRAVQVAAARDAFGRKAFLAAARIDPGLDPALPNLDAPTFGLTGAYRDKSGSSGTSRLRAATSDLTASTVQDLDRFTIRLHFVSLDAGPASGPVGVAWMTTRLPLGLEPLIAWERQTASAPLLSPFAEIGLTPLGGVVDPTLQGQGGVAWQGAAGSLKGTAYRQSITESLLSFTGIVDPATGRRFGRVTETGGKLEGYLQVAPRWGLFGQAALGVRDGVQVKSNLHAAAAATLSYDFRPPGFDTLTLGPSYQFSAFQHDLSGFTPGQGGYYSPIQSHTAGTALRFQTAEPRDAVIRGSLFTGWQFARSAGAATGSGHLAASRQDGFNSVGEVVAAYRLTSRWVLGAMLRYQVSPQFTDLYGGLALTFSLGDRAKLLSADLPHFDAR